MKTRRRDQLKISTVARRIPWSADPR